MIKNILFPIDGNKHSLKALDLVKEFALKHNAKVTVLHSYFLPSHFNTHSSSHYIYLSNIEHNLKEHGQKILEETVNKLKEEGVNAHFTLIKGPPGPSIVETAKNSSVDLIIMSNRGLGNIKSALLNSVSNYVLHHSHCPVLLVK
jgi:nucleotide-binding universal stress UspA family protein